MMGRYISFRIRSRRRAFLLQEPFGIGAEGLLLVGHTFRFYFLTIRENQSLLAEAMSRAGHAVVALVSLDLVSWPGMRYTSRRAGRMKLNRGRADARARQ
jgi:hypothetical protein